MFLIQVCQIIRFRKAGGSMARKSRKLEQLSVTTPSSSVEQCIAPPNKTAIYGRLSLYDIYRPDPDSMKYQIKFVKGYVESHPDLHLVDTYIDNGETGMNYNRPAFQRLIQDIYNGKINCVVVKDLSRFGRNYIETGMYLQDIFPEYEVRFIAINDEYDSKYNDANDLSVILKNILNDFFSREISRKVSATYDILMDSGNYIGNIVPVGYLKDPDRPYHYIKDPSTAPYIEMVFDWFLSGTSMLEIAYRLTEMHVPNTLKVHYQNATHKKQLRNKGATRWTGTNVKHMLSNPIYAGDTAICKYRNRRYLLEGPVNIPREEWIIHENTHEAYISHEQQEQILKILDDNKIRNRASIHFHPENIQMENIYKGILRCGICGYTLFRTTETDCQNRPGLIRYNCNSQHYNNRIRGHILRINKKIVDVYVQAQLIQEFQKADFLKDWLTKPETGPKIIEYMKMLQQWMADTQISYQKTKEKKLHLLEMYQQNAISKEDLQLAMEQTSEDQRELQITSEQLTARLSDDKVTLSPDNPWLRLFADVTFPSEFTSSTMQTFFQEIFVYPKEQIVCVMKEAVWCDRLTCLYNELEKNHHDL